MALINTTLQPNRIIKMGVEFKTTRIEWPNGRISRRREWTIERYRFTVEWDGITLAEWDSLKAFFIARSGAFGVFEFDDTNDDPSTQYSVTFEEDLFPRTPVRANVRGLYKLKMSFVEDKV